MFLQLAGVKYPLNYIKDYILTSFKCCISIFLISLENLFQAWNEFKKGKTKREDVFTFEYNLEENIFKLHRELKSKKYKHGAYTSFFIHDPKKRNIHKAEVRNRVLHHAIFKSLNPIFEPTFIPNSFSCRIDRGTHKGVSCLYKLLRKVSGNGHKPCFALKCDIKKFFDSVDHDILYRIIKKRINDQDTLWLIWDVIDSYVARSSISPARQGLPIGNLTSQLFANVYMNEFDWYVKHYLRIKNYIRYTDDFIIVAESPEYLEKLIPIIGDYLKVKLNLSLHDRKVIIRSFNQGIDFLGYVLRPHYKAIRTKTKHRAFRKTKQRIRKYKNQQITEKDIEQTINSYLGVFSHANTYKLSEKFKNQYWFWLNE